MIHDAVVPVTCDICECNGVDVEPRYLYRGYSGNNGYYDCEDSSIEKQLSKYGWEVKDGKHICNECKETEWHLKTLKKE